MVACKGIKTYMDLLEAWEVLMKHSHEYQDPWSERQFKEFFGRSRPSGQLTIGLEDEYSIVRYNYSLQYSEEHYLKWKSSFMEKHNKNLQ